MSHGYSEEDLAALSPEERAAVEADVDPEELTATANPVDTDDDEGGEEEVGENEGTDEGEEEAKPPVEEPGTDDPPKEEEAETPPVEEPPAEEPKPEPREEKLPPVNPYEYTDAAKEQLKALREQLSDGDLSQAEYEDQADVVRSNDYRQRLQAQEDANWSREVSRFMADPANAEFKADGNAVKHVALDGLLRHWATNEPGQIEGLSPREILAKGKAEIQKAFGGQKQGEAPPAKPPARPAAQRPQTPNLGDLPAAGMDNPRANTSEFSHLDKLSGGDLESALEKLSPEQQDRYLAGR